MPFKGIPIKTFELEDLVGKTLTIHKSEGVDGVIIFGSDTEGNYYILGQEVKRED